MEKCLYSYYAGGNCCKLLVGGREAKVEEAQFRMLCCDPEGYRQCPRYEAWLKERTGQEGCYLTTACVKARGLPDNCHELETLRAFRDNWLRHQPGGEAAIAEYYATAPAIVEKIERAPGAEQVCEGIYRDMVQPCVQMIEAGQMEQAFRRYRTMTLSLQKRWLGFE